MGSVEKRLRKRVEKKSRETAQFVEKAMRDVAWAGQLARLGKDSWLQPLKRDGDIVLVDSEVARGRKVVVTLKEVGRIHRSRSHDDGVFAREVTRRIQETGVLQAMKTLKQHNSDIEALRRAFEYNSHKADVACDACGEEMVYVRSHMTEPRVVRCPSCGAQGVKK